MRLGFTECGTEIKGEALMGCGAEMFQERTMPLEISAEHLRQCEDVVPVGGLQQRRGRRGTRNHRQKFHVFDWGCLEKVALRWHSHCQVSATHLHKSL